MALDLARLYSTIQAGAGQLTDDVRALVALESPTGDVTRLDGVGALLTTWWTGLGATVSHHELAGVGSHLEIRWSGGAPDHRPPALLVGHTDTVHDVGALGRNPLRIEGGRLYGPGTQDMKAGLVLAVHAARGLHACGVPAARPVTMLVTVDEESGSVSSSGLITTLARESAHAFVLEACGPGGELKTARKGVALYEVTVTGRAAHAGMHFDEGRNAAVGLAALVPGVADLTDPEAGTTVNVGVLRGGTRSNIVAETARAEIDVRFLEPAEADRVDRALRSLAVADGLGITISGGVNRPAMQRTDASAALASRAAEIAADLGFELGELAVGGASDGNFTAAAGCPTLDGLGALGAGLHTADEWVDVAALPARAALLAGLLATA